MTDHLEQYRQMVRSMRFFPPLSLNQPSTQPMAQQVIPTQGGDLSPKKSSAQAQEITALSPPVDPSERAATLIQGAVAKPTILPVSYTIPENIGDRISQLATPKPVEPVIVLPKLPQSDAQETSAPTIESQPMKADEQEPVVSSVPSKVGDNAVAVGESPSDDSVARVAQPPAVEQTTDDQAVASVANQPVEVEETPKDEQVAGVAESVAVETMADNTSSNDTSAQGVSEPVATTEATSDNITDADTPTTEAEDAQAPTILEQVSSAIAAVSKAFKKPESEVNQEAPETDVSPTAPDAFAATAERLEPDASTDEAATDSTPNLLERVAAVVEAVTSTLTAPDADKKESEAAVESAAKADEKSLNGKSIEIACPECQSPDIHENGQRQGKQRYICKDCGKQFVISDGTTLEDSSEIEASSKVKTSNSKEPQASTAVSGNSSKSSKSHSKKKTKPKGFGGSKAK